MADANTVVGYLAGGMLILFSLIGFLLYPLAGAVFLLTGLFALPVVRDALDARIGVTVSRLAVVAIVLTGSVGGTIALGAGVMATYDGSTTTNAPTATPASGSQEQVAQQTDSPQQDTETGRTHAVGEEFTVGSGAKQVRYSVLEAKTATVIGGGYSNSEADGVFVIVTIQMENTGDETLDITSRHLTLVDSQERSFETDSDAMIHASTDDRLQHDTILFEQLHPGLTTTGILIYDVPKDGEYALKVSPVGILSGADPHYVGIGRT